MGGSRRMSRRVLLVLVVSHACGPGLGPWFVVWPVETRSEERRERARGIDPWHALARGREARVEVFLILSQFFIENSL